MFLLPQPAQRALSPTLHILYCSTIQVSNPHSPCSPVVGTDWPCQRLSQKFSAIPMAVPWFPPGGATMWQVCFAVLVAPAAIFAALGLLGLLICGGEGG
jgi:hypothetical protein